MIRPPSEMERRVRQIEEMKGDESETDSNHEWDGDDGCDDESENCVRKPVVSKAIQEIERAKQEKTKKMALLCKAAQLYKGRPVSIESVAMESHPIRRYGENALHTKSTSVLEVSMVVFGQELDCQDSDDGSAYNEHSQFKQKNDSPKVAALQLVRMVNGVPLLDSPEAVACGLVQKISANATIWNSFGLDLALMKLNDSGEHAGDDAPMFAVDDSAQVAPFFRESVHGLFEGRENDSDWSSDGETFDPNPKRKRKKEKGGLLSLLPAALRLGEMMMIVQIRAKPSTLPLPTLSKVRFVMSCLFVYINRPDFIVCLVGLGSSSLE